MAQPSTPTWDVPSSPGQLTNKHATNTSTDLVALTARYQNPSLSDKPGGIRVVAQRTQVAGVPTPTPNVFWDTAWVGQAVTSNLPFSNGILGANGALAAYGRIYLLVPGSVTPSGQPGAGNVIAGIMSAPVNGANVGAWRWEMPLAITATDWYGNKRWIQDTVSPGAICRVYDFLYVMGVAGVYFAPLNSDGTIGTWQLGFSWSNPTSAPAGSMMTGWQILNNAPVRDGAIVIVTNVNPSVLYAFRTDPVTGQPGPNAAFSSTLPVQRGYGALHIEPIFVGTSKTWVIGGEDNTGAPQTSVYWNTIDYPPTGSGPSTWNAGTDVLPAARSRFGFTYWPYYAGGTDTWLYVCGGQATSGGAAQSTAYVISGTSLHNGTGGWTTFSGTGMVATKECAAAVTVGAEQVVKQLQGTAAQTGQTGQALQYPGPPVPIPTPYFLDSPVRTDEGAAALVVIGGSATNKVQVTNAGTSSRNWFNGAGPALTTTDLGGGSAVVNNADGSVSLTFPIRDKAGGGLGVNSLSPTLGDGDVVQVGVQIASQTTGDASPMSSTIIKVGQPPTLASVLPSGTITNGQPTVSFVYVPGAGGDRQDSYQITWKQGSTVIFDTGVRRDQLNSALLAIAPLLDPSVSWTLVITATSADVPMSGSTDQVVSTTTVTTSAFALPAAPGSFTAVPNPLTGSVAMSWAAAAGATGYNLYYQRSTAPATWYLLAALGNVLSYTAMDQIVLGVPYNFAVTTVNATPAESVRSNTQTVVLTPPAGTGYLHVAGNGLTYGAPLQVDAPPAFAKKLAVASYLGVGQSAPAARYGSGDFRAFSITTWMLDATTASIKHFLDILDQVKAGGVAVYRNGYGGRLVVTADADQSLTTWPPRVRELTLKLTEAPDTLAPYVATGSARGYLPLVSGSKQRLDESERLI